MYNTENVILISNIIETLLTLQNKRFIIVVVFTTQVGQHLVITGTSSYLAISWTRYKYLGPTIKIIRVNTIEKICFVIAVYYVSSLSYYFLTSCTDTIPIDLQPSKLTAILSETTHVAYVIGILSNVDLSPLTHCTYV